METKNKVWVNLIVAISVIIVLVIFGFTVYLLLDREAGKENDGIATLTDAIEIKIDEIAMATTEATTEELTTEIVEVTTEEPSTEVTTETTTEEITEEATYEEDYIYSDTNGNSSSYDNSYDYGQEEEVYESEPVDDYIPEEEYIEPEPVEENNEEPSEPNDWVYYGRMNTTAYEWTGDRCADERYPEVGYTAACNDPALWNHWIYIEGVGERYIHDTGSVAVMGYDTVDIYMGDVDTCFQYGTRTADIYIID